MEQDEGKRLKSFLLVILHILFQTAFGIAWRRGDIHRSLGVVDRHGEHLREARRLWMPFAKDRGPGGEGAVAVSD